MLPRVTASCEPDGLFLRGEVHRPAGFVVVLLALGPDPTDPVEQHVVAEEVVYTEGGISLPFASTRFTCDDLTELSIVARVYDGLGQMTDCAHGGPDGPALVETLAGDGDSWSVNLFAPEDVRVEDCPEFFHGWWVVEG